MIHWLTRTTAANPHIVQGEAPPGLLSEEEAAFFRQFTVRKRRQDWLLGRWTAKLLLQEMMRLEQGQIMALDQIVILPGDDGAPQATLNGSNVDPSASFTISISHSNGRSLCAAVALPEWPLGVDIERIEPRAANFAANFFTVRERQQLEQSDGQQRETLITAIWSGKEAALKAVRQGLRSDTRSLSCLFEEAHAAVGRQLPPDPGAPAFSTPRIERWLPFGISWEPKAEHGPPHLQGWWMVDDGFVLTMAVNEGRTKGHSSP